MGQKISVEYVFLDGNGEQIKPESVPRQFRVTMTDAVLLSSDKEDGQTWLVRHWVVAK